MDIGAGQVPTVTPFFARYALRVWRATGMMRDSGPIDRHIERSLN